MITPESLAKNGSESGHQRALFAWAAMQANGPTEHYSVGIPELRLLFAIPNGGERNKIVAANLKAEGVKDGVPDIFFPVPRGGWHGLFIELKRPESNGKRAGKATPEQLKWIAGLQKQGYGAVVCVGWEEARDTIIQYLNF